MKNILDKFNPFGQKTALVLGGGGARGIAHLGVIEYLMQNHISFDAVFGTSAGALFGSLYAMTQDAQKALFKYREVIEDIDFPEFEKVQADGEPGIKNTVRNMYYSIKKSAWVIRGVIRQSLIERGLFEELLDVFFGDTFLEDLPVRTYIIATDMITGKDIVFTRGKLSPIVQGSSSIAGVLPPVEYKGRMLIDGGTTAKLPVAQAVMMGFNRIIAVDVGSAFKEVDKFNNAIDIFSRIEKIASRRFHFDNTNLADILIRPQLDDLNWYDFKKIDIIYNRGFSKATEMASNLRRFERSLFVKRKHIPESRFMKFCSIE